MVWRANPAPSLLVPTPSSTSLSGRRALYACSSSGYLLLLSSCALRSRVCWAALGKFACICAIVFSSFQDATAADRYFGERASSARPWKVASAVSRSVALFPCNPAERTHRVDELVRVATLPRTGQVP